MSVGDDRLFFWMGVAITAYVVVALVEATVKLWKIMGEVNARRRQDGGFK